MTSIPSVSIAIRAYRRLWLGQAIASVLGQTHADLELIVYDDAGDLREVTNRFDDARLRYHRASEHLGVAGRYNAALALCRGRYVGLLDDDDRYEPDFVARLVMALEADPRIGAAVSHFTWECRGHVVLPSSRPPGPQVDAARALVDARWSPTPSTTLLRRSALLDGERRLPMPEGVVPDLFVNVRTVAAGWRIVFIDSPLVVKRWHARQLSRERDLPSHDLTVATWRQLPGADPELDGRRRRQLARALTRRAGRHLLDDDRSRARLDLHGAWAEDSRSWRWRRRALLLASIMPSLGRAALRLYFALPHVRRRREQPPGTSSGVARGAAAIAAGGATAQVLVLLTAPALTRLYGPSALGAASVAIGVMAIAAPLACLRFDVAIPLARDRPSVADLCVLCLATGTAMAVALGIVVATVGDGIAQATHIKGLAPWLWLVPLQVCVAAVGLVVTGLLVRVEKYRVLGRTRWAQAGAMCTTQLAGGAAGMGPPGLIVGALSGSVAYAAAGIAASNFLSRLRSTPGRVFAAMRRYGRFAAWSTTGAGFYVIGIAALPIFVAVLYGPAAGGLFVLAQRLVQAPVQVTGDAVSLAWFGTAARLIRTDATAFRSSLLHLTARLSLAGAILLPVAVFVRPAVLAPLFGDRWSHAADLLPTLAAVQLAMFLAIPAGQALQALERSGIQAMIAAARFAAGAGGLLGASALGWSLSAGLELYAAGTAVVSTTAIAVALRLAARAAPVPGESQQRGEPVDETGSTRWARPPVGA